MALEAVVYAQDRLSYGCKDYFYYFGGGAGEVWGYEDVLALQDDHDSTIFGISDHNIINTKEGVYEQTNLDSSSPSLMQNVKEYCRNPDSSNSPENCTDDQSFAEATPAAATGRRKRRRTKSTKNEVEMENQRMTHIAVERNRRKQMNEYLALLRSLMPPSYVQRGDQASIVGGAINFVKELEQLLQSMEVYKIRTNQEQESQSSHPFSQFFIFPQYSICTTQCNKSSATDPNESMSENNDDHYCAAAADIEVNMVESHANLKILAKKVHPRQLLKMLSGFQILRLTVLHLNVTSAVDHMVLYSFSVKVEEGCQMNTGDEIAAAVNQMLRRIQEEAAASFT